MSNYNSGALVKVSSTALEDNVLRSNHHLIRRIIQEDKPGEIRELDTVKSTPQEYKYWVKFHYGAILLSEKHLASVQ